MQPRVLQAPHLLDTVRPSVCLVAAHPLNAQCSQYIADFVPKGGIAMSILSNCLVPPLVYLFSDMLTTDTDHINV